MTGIQDETEQKKNKESHCHISVCPDNKSADTSPDDCFNHFRYVVVIFGGFMMGFMYLFRFTINVAIISMVNKTAIYYSEHPGVNTTGDFFAPDYIETGEFNWNHEIQQILLTGYMVSYALPQYIATRLSIKHGLGRSIPVSLALSAISCILTPYFSYYGWEWVLALRLLNGIGAAAIVPTTFNLVEIWVPERECPRALALLQFITAAINCANPTISGFLSSYHWRWSFYVPGLAGLVFCLLWYIIVADKPAYSNLISRSELACIYGADRITNDGRVLPAKGDDKTSHRADVPWHFVFKIKSFYFLSFALIALDATASGFLFILPTYINRMLQVPVSEVGSLTSVVQIGSIFCMLLPNPAADYLQTKFKLSLTRARTITTFVCCFMVCSTYVYLAFFHEDLVFVLTINRFFHMAIDFILLTTVMSQFSGEGLSGLVFSVVNAIGNFGVLACCWTMGRVLDYAGDSLECWSWILITLASIMALYFLNYAFFLSSEPVHVDLTPSKKKQKKDVAVK